MGPASRGESLKGEVGVLDLVLLSPGASVFITETFNTFHSVLLVSVSAARLAAARLAAARLAGARLAQVEGIC